MTLDEEIFVEKPVSRTRQWGLIGVSIVVFVLTLVMGIQLIGTLMGVLSPPKPPLPPNSSEVSSRTDSHGRDRWVYSVAAFPEAVLTFYASHEVQCERAPFTPDRVQELRDEFADASVLEAHCSAEQQFDRFVMRWQVLVSSSPGSTLTRLDFVRQIDWFAGSS